MYHPDHDMNDPRYPRQDYDERYPPMQNQDNYDGYPIQNHDNYNGYRGEDHDGGYDPRYDNSNYDTGYVGQDHNMNQRNDGYVTRQDNEIRNSGGNNFNRQVSTNTSMTPRHDNRYFPQQNNQSAYGQENNAYGQENNAYGQENNAYGQDNNVYGQENNAYGQENNAYGQDNNGNWGDQNYGYNDPTGATNPSYPNGPNPPHSNEPTPSQPPTTINNTRAQFLAHGISNITDDGTFNGTVKSAKTGRSVKSKDPSAAPSSQSPFFNQNANNPDDRTTATGGENSEERAALSMAIRHHTHKLLESDVDINDVWDMDDPLDDTEEVIRARNKIASSVIHPPAESTTFIGKILHRLRCCDPILMYKKYYLPGDSKQIRIFLFVMAVAASTFVAWYFRDGSLGIILTETLSKTSEIGPTDDTLIDDVVTPNDDTIIDTGLDEKLLRDIKLPKSIDENLSDSSIAFREEDTAFYWLIPKSGGNVVRNVMSQCFKMVEASDLGKGYESDQTIQILRSKQTSNKFINVDMTSSEGIERAEQLGLVASGLADVIISPILHEIVDLFSTDRNGKMFTLLRHPMDVAFGKYKSSEGASALSIEEYFSNESLVDNNWMTRHLINKMDGSLTENDLKLAMEILRRKFIIGMVDQVRESVKRFLNYFGWALTTDVPASQAKACMEQVTQRTGNGNQVEEGSDLWNLILKHNQFDVRLFEYAVRLFQEQSDNLPKPDF